MFGNLSKDIKSLSDIRETAQKQIEEVKAERAEQMEIAKSILVELQAVRTLLQDIRKDLSDKYKNA